MKIIPMVGSACEIRFTAPLDKIHVRRYVIDRMEPTGILSEVEPGVWVARDFFEFWATMKQFEL